MPTHYNKSTNEWTSTFQDPGAVLDAFNRITSIRAGMTQMRSTIDHEKWTHALFRLIEVKRQMGELEALIRYNSHLVEATTYGGKQIVESSN